MEICVLKETCVVFVLTTILSGVHIMGPFRLVYFELYAKQLVKVVYVKQLMKIQFLLVRTYELT